MKKKMNFRSSGFPRVRIPLKKELLLFIILLVSLLAVTFFISLSYFTRFQNEDMKRILQTYSAEVAKNVTDSYTSYESIAYSIAYDQAVQQYLLSDSPVERYGKYQTLNAQLTKMSSLNSYISDIAVYGTDGTFASLNGTRQDYDVLWNTYNKGEIPYQEAGTTDIGGILCQVLIMPVYASSSQIGFSKSRYLGALFIAVDLQSLFSNTTQMADSFSPQVLFTNAEGKLIYGNEDLYNLLSAQLNGSVTSAITQISTQDTVYSYAEYNIPTTSNILYVLSDTAIINARAAALGERLFAFSMVILCIVIFLLLLLYLPMLHTLTSITDFMNQVSSGNQKLTSKGLVLPAHLVELTELCDIADALNNLLLQTRKLNHRIFDNYTRMYQMEEENRAAEIGFLRSQVNPHFLYNTLTMICGMAADHDNEKIVDVTNALSRIFRYSIKGSDMVPLGEEMEIVRAYLMIQKERFGDRFTVRYEVSETDAEFVIPKMIIQPLAENAIVHGLEHTSGGELIIGTEKHDAEGYLSIFVYDSGRGMNKEQLESLRIAISGDLSLSTQKSETEHLGIRNVNSRLVLYYGREYHLRIASEQDEGTSIEIRIPYNGQAGQKICTQQS